MSYNTLLFDLDGTLIDSIPDLTISVNILRSRLDLPPIDAEQVRGYVGDGVGLLVQRALPQGLFSEERRREFTAIYTEHLTDSTFIYPGIIAFLETHRNSSLAVVTNKPQRLAEEVVQRLGLGSYFETIIGDEPSLQKKPHPDMILKALRELSADPGESLMFGDHHVDLRAAQAAGVAACFCEWGFGHTDGLSPDYLSTTPQDLPRLFPGRTL